VSSRSASIRAVGRGAASAIRALRPVPADVRVRADAALAEVVAAGHPEVADWDIVGWRSGDPISVDLGSGAGPQRKSLPIAVLRLAGTAAASAGLGRAAAAIRALRAAATPEACALVPELLGVGGPADGAWSVERWLPGVPGQKQLHRDDQRRIILRGAATAVRGLQEPTIRRLEAADLDRLVERRLGTILDRLDGQLLGVAERDRMRRAAAGLRTRLDGATVRLGWIHGDLWLGNVLVAETTPGVVGAARAAVAPHGPAITGIVDWDSAGPDEPLLLDLLHLAVTTRRHVDRRSLGAAIADRLGDGTWRDDDAAVLGGDVTAALDGIAPADALRMLWLQAIAANLARHPTLGRDRSWVAENVLRVVAWL
jgi:aminoglycoside phosphotransferase (APT) family kinase protein